MFIKSKYCSYGKQLAFKRIVLIIMTLGLFAICSITSNAEENQEAWAEIKDEIREKFADFQIPKGFQEQYATPKSFVKVLRCRGESLDRYISSPEELKAMEPLLLKDLFNRLVLDELLYEAAIQSGYLEEREDIKKSLELSQIPQLAPYIYEEKVVRPSRQISKKELKAEYNRNKMKYYYPMKVNFCQIHLSTYREYVVQFGDDLDSIARRVSRNRNAIRIIRYADTKKPVWDMEQTLAPTLQAGQKLLVPMSSKEKRQIRHKMKSVLNLLKDGEDFVEVAKQYSDSPDGGVLRIKIPETESRPILPKVLKALRYTSVGAVSPIVETEHGFDIFKVEDRRDSFYKPVEEVKSSLSLILIDRKLVRLRDEFMNLLENRYQDNGALKVLELYPKMRHQEALLCQYGLDEGIDKTPGFLSAYRAFKINQVCPVYMASLIDQLVGSIEDGKYIKLMGGESRSVCYETARIRAENMISEFLLEKSGVDYQDLLKK